MQHNAITFYFSSLQIGGTYMRALVLPPEVCIGAFGKLQVRLIETTGCAKIAL